MKKIHLILFAALCMVFTACEKNEGPADGSKAKYTVILYANGGENLDDAIEADIARAAEFLNTKSKDYSVRMVTYMKYSSTKGLAKQNSEMLKNQSKRYIPGGKAGKVYLYEVGSACIDFKDQAGCVQNLQMNDKWVVDDSLAAMYDPAYMAKVLKDIARLAPAENYIFVIAGHAGGWNMDADGDGYPTTAKKPAIAMTDAFHKGRAIKAKELHDGIMQSGLNVSAVIFDCCMMNSIEYLSEMTDITKFALGSGHTTHGGDYQDLLKELFNAPSSQAGLQQALSAYAETYAKNHKKDYEDYHNPVLMNTDFAVVDMAKLKNVWEPLKKITDFLCTNYKAADSAKYVIPARDCYQYFNADCKYDLMDYLTFMAMEGAPYEDNTEYEALLDALDKAVDNAIVSHAYSLNYVDPKRTQDKVEAILSMSINIGAKGCFQADYEGNPQLGYKCYDSNGDVWYFNPKDPTKTWWKASGTTNNPAYNWTYSYAKSVFEQRTGWTRWVKLNPVMPFNNPPFGDDGDTNGMEDDDDSEDLD